VAERKSFSIQVVIRRVTTEIAFVHVPVGDAVLLPADEEGNRRLDTDKMLAAAVAMGSAPGTSWAVDGVPEISVNPIQMPHPDSREPTPERPA
jgi:hypothetical protein